MGLVLRRVSAFILDMFLITFITMALSNLSYLNPYKYEAEEIQKNYLNNYSEFMDNIYEMDEIDVNGLLNKIAHPYQELVKSRVFTDIYYILTSFLYFVCFAYFNKGQTIGKKVFKLKIVGNTKEKITFTQMILKNLIYGSNLYMGINLFILIRIILIFSIKESVPFFYISAIMAYGQIIIEIISIVWLLKNKNRSLSDIISSTKVIDLK